MLIKGPKHLKKPKGIVGFFDILNQAVLSCESIWYSFVHMKKNQTTYVDGFVLVVPKKNVKAYTKMAKEGAELWMKYGALDYKECMGDDLPSVMGGMKVKGFKALANAKPTDTIWYSFITFKSRAHRDSVNKKVNKAMGELYADQKDFVMPFDMNKMSYGGFKVMVSA